MDIKINWVQSMELLDGTSNDMVYVLPEKFKIPTEAGIYIFARKYGETISAVYIGKADNLRQRLEQQFDKVQLMMALRNSGKGKKVLLWGRIKTKGKKKLSKIFKIIEPHFIEYATINGHELVNIKGTKSATHKITNVGNLDIRKILKNKMNLKK